MSDNRHEFNGPFMGHVDRDAFERSLRQAYSSIPESVTQDSVLSCQARGGETSIAFALYIADELNRGTTAEVLVDAASRVLGVCAANLAVGFETDDGSDVLKDILGRIGWQASRNDGDAVAEISVVRPQTMGSRA